MSDSTCPTCGRPATHTVVEVSVTFDDSPAEKTRHSAMCESHAYTLYNGLPKQRRLSARMETVAAS